MEVCQVKLPRIGPEDTRQSILVFRWLIVLVSILLMLHGPSGLKLSSAGYFLAVFFFLSNLALGYVPRSIFRKSPFILSVLFLDVILVSMVISFTGGAATDLFLLYLFVMFTAVPASSLPVSAVIAVCASGYYAVITGRTAGLGALLETTFLMKIPFFFVVAVFGSLISRQTSELRKNQEENRRLSSELRWKLEKARKSEEKLHDDLVLLYTYNENILNSIESGVIALDLNGTITAFNRAAEKITGLKCDSVLFEKAASHKALQELGSVLMDALETPVRRKEIEIQTACGEEKTIGISTYLMEQRRQKVVGVVAVFADLTEIRNLQKRVRNSENLAMLGEMAACVAHEVRNPLSSIQGLSELLFSSAKQGDERKIYAKTILEEAQRIDRIIRDILAFSRPKDPEKKPLDLNVLVEETVQSMKPTMDKSDASVEWLPETGLPLVSGEASELQKVLSNLLLNAVQAVDQEGKVSVATRRDGENVVLEVKDNGCGIPKKIQRKVFNPFFTTKDEGAGLGLAMARKIVEEHGGSISLESNEGTGTQFTVRLPIPESPVTDGIAAGSEEAMEKTILVADDDAYIRDIFTEVLAADGYEVILAEDGEETIKKAVANQVDLLILDIKMPVIDGLQVLEHMSRVKPELPIIVTTGYADMKTDCVVKNSNVIEYLQKPIHVVELRGSVLKALKNTSDKALVG
jgi:PAS domain S-box-containing protein